MKGRIRKQLLAATLGVSLLQLVALGVVGSLLLGAATGELRAQQTLNTEAIARLAQAITVRLEGATQGSGVLVKREENRYTVLTAWHVVSGQRPGEELAIITPDGKQNEFEAGSIRRLGNVDLAVLSFSSATSYAVAQLGDTRSVAMGNPIYVAGFPLASSAVPTRLLRFLDGRVVANATMSMPNGYELLYSGLQPTLPGMSGGPVLNGAGQLLGIHGQSETEDQKTEQEGVFVKTGTSQAVSIGFYLQFTRGTPAHVSPVVDSRNDDYLARIRQLLAQKGQEQEALRMTNLVLRQTQSADAFALRAYVKSQLGDKHGAIADNTQALAINPRFAEAYNNRGTDKSELGDKQGAIADYNQALAINPRFAEAYSNRGNAKLMLGDRQSACADYRQSISLGNKNTAEWIQTEAGAWCRRYPNQLSRYQQAIEAQREMMRQLMRVR